MSGFLKAGEVDFLGDLIILAAYWNERALIDASLDQLEALAPTEAIIADGCFDPRLPTHSDDGTLERIRSFASGRPWVRVVEPVRRGRVWHAYDSARRAPFERRRDVLARLRLARLAGRTHLYRLNQAATFNAMLRMSEALRPAMWVMTLDADEYFTDATSAMFRGLSTTTPGPAFPVRERTFMGSLSLEAPDYPGANLRTWNIPIKVPPTGLRFFPTRGVLRQRPGIAPNAHYVPAVPEVRVGTPGVRSGEMHHLKMIDPERGQQSYVVGDRRPPSDERTRTIEFTGAHPTIVERWFRSPDSRKDAP